MKPKLFIIEGPDGSGKTTLSHALQRATKGVLIHGRSMGDNSKRLDNERIMKRYHESLLEIMELNLQVGHSVIVDRHWVSHLCYNLNLTAAQHAQYWAGFQPRLEALGAKYIFALDPSYLEVHRANIDPDHPYPDGYLEKVYQQYLTIFPTFKANKWAVAYNFTVDGGDNGVAFVDHLLYNV